MKKVLLSLGIIALVAGVVAGATFALFSDQAEVAANTISTGTADLEVRGHGWHDGSYYDRITFDMNWDNVYPGWTDSYDVRLKNASSSDIVFDVTAHINIDSGNDSDGLREVIEMEIYNEDGDSVAKKTLADWRDEANAEHVEFLAQNEEGDRWTLEFSLPSSGEVQNDLQGKGPLTFDLIFNGIQAEAPITEVTNETQEETYENLEAAIEAASAGDTILIPNGTYDGFYLGKGLTLKGVGDNVVIESKFAVDSWARPNGIYVNTDGEVNVENIRFENGGIDLGQYPQGIVTETGRNPEINISNSEFTDLYIGVYLNPGASGLVANNVFDGVDGESHTAIGIDTATDVEVIDNDISNSDIGIEIFGGNVTESGNTFTNVTDPVVNN